MGITSTWGSTPSERARAYPCDGLVAPADDSLFRAVDVRAPAATTFRWLCQLRVAPYSYDWIDNRGRRSPRELTPGLEHLELGQRCCSIFRLVDFARDDHLTLRSRGPVFGDVVITYRVRPDPAGSRLAVKLLIRYPGPPWGWIARAVLPAGDLVMMHKQLTNLAGLAEATTSREG